MILLTPRQTAEYLQLSEIQVRRLLAANKIPHFKIGRVNRVNQEELDAWLMKRARQEAVGSFKQKREYHHHSSR